MANIEKIKVNNTSYDIVDATAAHELSDIAEAGTGITFTESSTAVDNYTEVGTPTISSTGYITQASENDYVTTEPLPAFTDAFDVICKVNVTNIPQAVAQGSILVQSVITTFPNVDVFEIYPPTSNNQYFKMLRGNEGVYTNEETPLQVSLNTEYWLKLSFAAPATATATLSVIEDNGYTKDTLPTAGWTTSNAFQIPDWIYVAGHAWSIGKVTGTTLVNSDIQVDLNSFFITSNGETVWEAVSNPVKAVISTTALQNTATGTNSLTIAGTATSQNGSMNIGSGSKANSGSCTAVGVGSQASYKGTSLGSYAEAAGIGSVAIGGVPSWESSARTAVPNGSSFSIAIGSGAKIGANIPGAIQLGQGTNSVAGSLQASLSTDGTNFTDYQLLDATGKIPDARYSSSVVTTNTEQTITADKTISGKLNKNSSDYGVVLPDTTGYTANKVVATTDLIKEIYQHYINFYADNNKTIVCTTVSNQSNVPFTAATFAEYLYDILSTSSEGISATGTVTIGTIDHKTIGMVSKGSSNTSYTIYPLLSTGGFDNAVTLNVSSITSFTDTVELVGAHGAPGVDPIPSQVGNAGKFLSTNGSLTSWENVAVIDSDKPSSSTPAKYVGQICKTIFGDTYICNSINNVTINGTVDSNVEVLNGVLTGRSFGTTTNTKVETGVTLGASTSYEIIMKIYKYGRMSSSAASWLITGTANIQTSSQKTVTFTGDNKFRFYVGWTGTTKSAEIDKDTWYWVKVAYDGSTTTLDYLTDNGYDLTTLPSTGWTSGSSYNGNVFGGETIKFTVNHFNPAVDFKGVQIKDNGTVVYTGTSAALTPTYSWTRMGNVVNDAQYPASISIGSYEESKYAYISGQNSISVGEGAIAYGFDGTAIGRNSNVQGNLGIAIGSASSASGVCSVGLNGKATAGGAIMLGFGENADAKTFKVALNDTMTRATDEASGLYELLDSTGKIPAGRLTISTSVSSSSTNAEVVGSKLFYDTCGDIETLINAL